jgi:hypothetical protein
MSVKHPKVRKPSKADEDREAFVQAAEANRFAAASLRQSIEELPAKLAKTMYPDRGIHAWRAIIALTPDGQTANVHLVCQKCQFTSVTCTIQLYAQECRQ